MKGEPRTLDVLKALTRLIEGVTYGNNYAYDLRGRVFRGRTAFGTDSKPPFVSLLEAPQTEDRTLATAAELGRKAQIPWTILVQGFAAQDPENPSDPAYYLMAAVAHRLTRTVAQDKQGRPLDDENYLLGRRINGLEIRQGLVSGPRGGVSDHAFFYLPIVLNMTHDPARLFLE